jgi:transcriptional regulator with XRE-family HTH domain
MISDTLKRARWLTCLTQDELSHIAAIHTKTVSLYETSSRRPNRENLERLAAALGFSADDICRDAVPAIPTRAVFAHNCRQLRLRQALSYNEASSKGGLPVETLSRVELESMAASPEVRKRLKALYGDEVCSAVRLPSTTRDELAKKCRERINLLGLNKYQAAVNIGITRTTLDKFERGECSAHGNTALAVMKWLLETEKRIG